LPKRKKSQFIATVTCPSGNKNQNAEICNALSGASIVRCNKKSKPVLIKPGDDLRTYRFARYAANLREIRRRIGMALRGEF